MVTYCHGAYRPLRGEFDHDSVKHRVRLPVLISL